MHVRLMYLFLVLLILGSGCEETAEANHGDYNVSSNRIVQPIQPGPCGSLLVKQPMYNVNFTHPRAGRISHARMHILPNQTPEAAAYAVHECASLGLVNLSSGSSTSMNLPFGNYVLAYGSLDGAKIDVVSGPPNVEFLFRSNAGRLQWVAFSVIG